MVFVLIELRVGQENHTLREWFQYRLVMCFQQVKNGKWDGKRYNEGPGK